MKQDTPTPMVAAPTPETDKAIDASYRGFVGVNFARKLERERDEARRDTLDNTLVLAKHAEEQMLRAEKLEAALAERDAEIARLREDAERWQQYLKNPFAATDKIMATIDVEHPASWAKQVNAALDAARKQ